MDMLNVKAILDTPLKKIVSGAPSSVGGALVRLGHSLVHAKILECSTPQGLKYGLPKKVL